MALQSLPQGWSIDKLQAFNALNDACLAYMVFDNALTKLGVNNAILNQDRTDVGNLIKNVLGPALIEQG